MSDYDESFDDSFDSASDSDQGVEKYLQDQNETNIKTSTNYQSMFSGGVFGVGGLDVPSSRKDLQLLSANGAKGVSDSMSDDQEDWR